MRAESIRSELLRLVRQAPFRSFVISLENGDQITIGHAESIAFDPAGESPEFYVITGRVSLFGTFEAVFSLSTAESVEQLA